MHKNGSDHNKQLHPLLGVWRTLFPITLFMKTTACSCRFCSFYSQRSISFFLLHLFFFFFLSNWIPVELSTATQRSGKFLFFLRWSSGSVSSSGAKTAALLTHSSLCWDTRLRSGIRKKKGHIDEKISALFTSAQRWKWSSRAFFWFWSHTAAAYYSLFMAAAVADLYFIVILI